MKIKMLADIKASCNASGNATRIYKNAEIVDCDEQWQKDLANNLVASNVAMEIKIDEPVETKAKKKATKKKTTKKKS
tara:strand:+ start:5165 stop:5395 length:231 start_codon:yes stop_codon:yes gene_type:complete